jgi:hypothetical protein
VCISQFILEDGLKQKKSLIIKQISAAKSKVLKYLDDIEEKLITEVASVQEKNEEKINSEKHVLLSMTSSVSVIFDSRLYFLPFSTMFQSYNLVLLTYRKVKMNF